MYYTLVLQFVPQRSRPQSPVLALRMEVVAALVVGAAVDVLYRSAVGLVSSRA